ncbi:AraC family transcriptional regulator [Ottowia sp.]|uniref:AraC family transcriptional regulator n=1 Tax=Ottowia sp. TaxID=1898956 RepID=UPI003A8481E9
MAPQRTPTPLWHLPARTPVALVQAVVQAYAQRGLDPCGALIKAQITPKDIQKPGNHVTALQFERLCAAAMQELDDEAPGWFSRRLPWGSYGMLARASISAPTLGVALARWCRHHRLLTEDVTLSLTQHGDQARLDIAEHRDLGVLREFALLSLLRNVHGLASWLVDSHIALRSVQFPLAVPPHADLYARLFPGPVQFSAPHAALTFDAPYLQLPLRRDAPALDQMLRRALPIMVWPYRRDRLLSHRVRRLLQPAGSVHTADTLAAQLGLSTRSLHRQLAAEGSSLQALKDEVRCARASVLLLRTRQPIARVARAAGFASDKSFARAFRQWTGQTPQEHRQQGGQA